MSGFKTFAVGAKLTASDVNSYLMEQSVMVFGSTSDRNTALPSPTEGMVVYITNVDQYMIWNGSAWVIFDVAWKSWTPTLSGVTLGTGYTLSATYCQIGKTVIANLYFALGATSAITGDVSFSLPLNQASSNRSISAGLATVVDSSPSARYAGNVLLSGTPGYGFIRVMNSAGTYVTNTALSSTVPITFATSDALSANVIYEAA